uniref:Transformation/transcription domain-associated protein n=1 Tax=Plectus sambesii TaxID=2011161 RepID=A0A914VHX2_9BILA
MAGTGPFSFAQQQSLAKGVSAAASVTNLPILNQLDVLMKTLTDSAQRDDLKLKALQEISNHFEALAPTAAYPPLMDSLIRAFLKLFNETVPQFIGENNTQQLRKLMLEMTNRMPCNDYLKQYGKAIQQQMFKIIQTENEENVMIALKIVTEHQKQFRPQFSIEVQQFLHFCKGLYRDLPQLLPSIFEPRRNIRVNEIQELHIEQALAQAFCVTPIQTEQKHPDGSPVVYTLLPRGVQSLKVLAELPIVIVLLYQIHRTNVQNDIADFIPLILNMVNLCPSREQRNHPNFNRELFIEFLSAQVKALSFLAFLTRMFHEMVQVHSGSLVQGIMQLLEHCPPEVTHQRRELLMATRHLLGSELRVKFVPHLPKLFNENLMIGSGWTANETLRPLVFSMLADLVHHVRQQLNYVALSSSVHLFSRCIHDPTLPAYVQAMCCKLMLNLVECIVNTTERHPDQSIRELLFYMLEVFIRKFKVVAVQHLPAIMEKHSATNGEEVTSKVNGNDAIEKESEPDASPAEPEKREEEVPEEQKTTAVDSEDAGVGTSDDSSGAIARTAGQVTAVYWGVVAAPMSVHDCRSLVKVLVGGAKTTIWGIGNARVTGDSGKISPEKETELFFRLLRYGIQCLDIYTIMQAAGMPQGTYQRSHPTTSVRSKEEKEALDHFASVFTMLNPMTFKEIFAKNIEFLIDRIAGNYALQLICNSFLVNPLTSAKFGSILVEYLLEKLPEMGVSNDRAVLYLKLFKLVFTSVSCSQSTGCVENEQMLKPHLHRMVHRSMELALKGKEPINYFLLLRALFRSIGGGSHDLLYQEFLPLLPSLLQQLNRLQSGSHKQQMRELFVELCLTVPVRLSSLLPYLPLLMDPLVCALNGSQTLVQQGLRTLELCVDNLQPEYLYEHMAPVRAALMHGLWHTVGSTGDEAASLIAFRILGKFGGSNRKMLSDPQTLTHRTDPEMGGPAIAILYHDMTQTASSVPAADPPPAGSVVAKITMADAVKSAMEHLRSDSAEPAARRESWLYVKALLLAALKPSDRRLLEDDRLSKHLLARLEAIDTNATTPRTSAVYRCSDEASRSMFLDALTAVFFAVVAKDLRSEVLSFFNAIVRQLTLQAIFEQTGGEYSRDPTEQQTHMDGGVLVDAIANALADSSKDFCHSAIVALRFMKDTASAGFGSVEKASKLPLFRHMLDSLCGLCFRHAWYARLGGCTGLQYFLENFPKSLAQENAVTILCAYMEVMVGLSDEVSSGALDMAVHGVELLLKTCFKDGDFPVADRRRLVASILVQVVRRMDSPDQFLRQQCVSVVEQLATLTGETVISVLSLVKKELNDFLDRGQRDFSTMSMASQIGFMDAFAYLHTLDPLLFTFDLDDDSQKCFADALIKLCKTDESVLEKIPTYKSSMGTTTTNNTDLISLKCTAIRAAVACYIAAIQPVTVEMETNAGEDGEDEIRTITDRQQLFLTALKALTHGHAKLQDEAFAALRMAMKRVPMERNVLHAEMRPVLLNLSEYKTLSLNVVKRLLYLTRLSPNTFNEKFCDQILVHLKKWVESALVQQGTAKTTDEIKACEIVLEILHETPAASARFIDVVIPMITKAESQLNLEPGINWRIPLLRYLIRYPLETIQFLVQENNMRVEACRGLFLWLIKQEESGPLRQILTEDPSFINNLLNGQTTANNQDVASEVPLSSLEVLALRLISALSKRDPEWIAKNQHLINRIRSLWNDEKFKARYKSESSDHTKFEAPKLAVKCMLRYFRTNPNDIDLLFDICQCFVGRLSTDFSFVRSFLENEVVATYTVEWRRLAFKRAVDLYVGDYAKSGGPTLIVKILQYVILPCLAFSLEHGDGDKLIGSLPAPDEQNNENLVSLFVSRVIDNQKSKGQLPDGLHIMLYQLSCLFVEFAPQHIHDSSSKKQGSRLRTFMLFAWPCLQQNSQQDPTTKYTGHLLIAHIIDKFAINRKIVLQVFHSLLKAHQQDPRGVIRQALNILTPAVPLRMEDGYLQLMTFAKKIIIEEGHTPAQLFHLLQVIVRHYKVYYHVRHQLTQYLMNGIQKLVTSQGTVENRKLAVDVCEMVIKWELYRLKTSQQSDQPTSVTDPEIAQLLKSPSTSSEQQNGDKKASTSQPQVPENNNPIEKL